MGMHQMSFNGMKSRRRLLPKSNRFWIERTNFQITRYRYGSTIYCPVGHFK